MSHYAFVIKSDRSYYVYKNGQLFTNGNATYTWDPPNGDVSIVYSEISGGYWHGYFDDVRFYASALTSTEIQEVYSTVASIDNNNAFYTKEIKEIGPVYKPSLIDYSCWKIGDTQTYQLPNWNIIEDGNSILLKKILLVLKI